MKKHHLIAAALGAAAGYFAVSSQTLAFPFLLPDYVSGDSVGKFIGQPIEGAIVGAVYGVLISHVMHRH